MTKSLRRTQIFERRVRFLDRNFFATIPFKITVAVALPFTQIVLASRRVLVVTCSLWNGTRSRIQTIIRARIVNIAPVSSSNRIELALVSFTPILTKIH